MSNPQLYSLIYLLYGVLIAFGAPAAAGYYYGPLAAVGAVIVIIHVGLGLAMLLSEGEGEPMDERSTPAGPSFLAGSSILFVGMTVLPMTVIPAGVWMWILPVDVHGCIGRSHAFGLDIEGFRGPHHPSDSA